MYIPATSVEIDRIYSQIASQAVRSIAITAANSGEGVSSVAVALAQRNLLAGKSTLLVDLNLYHPNFQHVLDLEKLETTDASLEQPELISFEQSSIVLTGITAPTRREVILKLRQQAVIEQCIAKWLETFDTVIIDTSPLNRVNANNIPPERIAAACDSCLMVVLAGNSTESMIDSAVDKLNTSSATILGCVFNDRDNPTLKNELIRETKRLHPKLAKLGNFLEEWIHKNRLLSLDI